MKLEHALKGAVGEAKVAFGSLLTLPPSKYRRFNDVTLPSPHGGTTQIDHVFVSRFGVFVIETKNMSGWIYGHTRDRHWTQVFPTRKRSFQNPLHQNYRHVKAVEGVLEHLGVPPSRFVHSVVAFVGDARIKTAALLPRNVTTGNGWARQVRSFRQRTLSEDHVRAICRAMSSGRPAAIV